MPPGPSTGRSSTLTRLGVAAAVVVVGAASFAVIRSTGGTSTSTAPQAAASISFSDNGPPPVTSVLSNADQVDSGGAPVDGDAPVRGEDGCLHYPDGRFACVGTAVGRPDLETPMTTTTAPLPVPPRTFSGNGFTVAPELMPSPTVQAVSTNGVDTTVFQQQYSETGNDGRVLSIVFTVVRVDAGDTAFVTPDLYAMTAESLADNLIGSAPALAQSQGRRSSTRGADAVVSFSTVGTNSEWGEHLSVVGPNGWFVVSALSSTTDMHRFGELAVWFVDSFATVGG
jgi:hypothetical protein